MSTLTYAVKDRSSAGSTTFSHGSNTSWNIEDFATKDEPYFQLSSSGQRVIVPLDGLLSLCVDNFTMIPVHEPKIDIPNWTRPTQAEVKPLGTTEDTPWA